MTLPLRRRIIFVFVGLLLLVMALIMALVVSSNRRIVAAEAARELQVGTQVFKRLLDQNQRQLETAATVLAGDFAFREAIATQDQSTLFSVISNHGLRIGAQVMMAVNPEGQVIADTQPGAEPGRAFAFPELLSAAQTAGKSSGVRQMRDQHLYQIVVVPILAPRLIAWVAMGFEVDDRWAKDLSSMIGLEVSMVQSTAPQARILASSLPQSIRQEMAGLLAPAEREQASVIALGSGHWQTQQVPLGAGLGFVLQRPLDQIELPFNAMQNDLTLIILAGIALFALGSVVMARRIVRPINALASAAGLIESGDYSQPVPRLSDDEIGALATSVEHMRTQVAIREGKILRLAFEDALTGLPNRNRLIEKIEQSVQTSSGLVAVLNIDRFASINNALGFGVGDHLLTRIGDRLLEIQPVPLMLARLWGNEFAFLCEDMDRDEAVGFVDAVMQILREPVIVDGQRLDVGGTMGLALFPSDGRDGLTLLRQGEVAMRAAKQRHIPYVFANEMGDGPPPDQVSLIGEMREALERKEFVLYYQPKIDLAENRVSGAEALLRWQHPRRGLVPPGLFIPFAEQTGFIREITPWLVQMAVVQCAAWHRQGMSLVVSVNLSALDILNARIITLVQTLLAEHQLPAHLLCLEITESALINEPEVALKNLYALADLGVKLSIDDYGSGQASLGYLKSLPVHELKMDQSFVTGISTTPKNAAIVRSTIVLSHELGLAVTAEGVESTEDMEWLQAHACDLAQGYAIARPMPADLLPGWVARYQGQTEAA